MHRLLTGIKNKISLLIGRAILSAIDNSGKTMVIQVKGLKDEVISDVERIEEFGFTSYPKKDAEAVIIFINGNRDQGLAIKVHDREYRPTDLSEGDSCLYDSSDNRIWLKGGSELEISGTGLSINMLAANESYVKGDTFKTELDKDIDALTALQAAMNTWVPVPLDGGAALKAAVAAFLAKPMASSANILSTKIKGE